ncbi:MAG: hypothetical protein COU28_01270 [Candidatus Magasanikbacteria bacterium CG10_big_fil_rev_8_21_14_0_10_36_16]|uniref:Putative manganese efflux pump MntP n=1 Tax=Candidatus Magasanikbacteria bacterium CG10_big_fil_rev_8_21_14_0_10_36_16 TaxID=1974645 RepID=A0A2H0U107_9BACT|nr:MAG: hypothetical protein COU28_01270 [Candidatus Magasanikbacteria bacterium CG10_big_fil_rev_8_21_14_0_10_36_16]
MFTIFLIAISLSVDSFVIAASLSIRQSKEFWINSLKISLSFAFFQSLMPFLGFILGQQFVFYIERFSGWLAFFLLLLVGIKFIVEAFNLEEKKSAKIDWKTLVTLGVVTSIDALVVGLSLAFLQINMWEALIIISITTFFISWLGCLLGKKLSKKFGKNMEIVAGLILILIGLKILFSHLF